LRLKFKLITFSVADFPLVVGSDVNKDLGPKAKDTGRYDFSIPEPRQTYIFVNLVRCTLTNIFAFHQIRFASCRNLHLKFHQHEQNVNNTTSSQRISTAPCGVAQHRYGLQRYVRWTRSVRVAKYKL